MLSASDVANEHNTDIRSVNAATLQPKCLASTGTAFHGKGERHRREADLFQPHQESNFFKEAQFSADGTAVITHNNDQRLRIFIIPPDLLDETKQPHDLSAHSDLTSPSPVQSYALYPGFDLSDLATTVVLSASTDVPVRLTNAVSDNYVHATYLHINPKTEAYIAPSSLTFVNGGSHFVAGSQGLIAVFDSSRSGSGPISTHKTKPKDPQNAIYSMRDNSRITALSESRDGYLAAGSQNRVVGLFTNSGYGQCETAFSVAGDAREERVDGSSGTGITSIAWSPDGTNLLIAERQSDIIHVYDVRNQCKRLAFCSGRKARTTQKMGFSVLPTRSGYEVWAGGTDGCVRMWRNPGAFEEELKPDAELIMHDDAVSSAVWHPDGLVLATCSGQRAVMDEEGGGGDSGSEHSVASANDEDDNIDDENDDEDSESVTDDSDDSDDSSTSSAYMSTCRGGGAKRSNALDNKLKIWSV